MKRLILLFISAFSLAAQTTTVSQSVLGPDGQPANGRVSIQISQACKSGSNYVGMKPINVTVSNGVFSQALVPNDSCIPAGTSYAITWQLQFGNGWTETWLVPTSSIPVTVDSVVTQTAPASSFIIQWQQMGQNGAAIGQSPIWNGSAWLPGTVSGGSEITGAPGTWPDFAAVATTGAYASLSGLPTIPSTTTQISEGTNLYFTNLRAIAALAGLYQTPITGAPGTWPTFATVATSGNYNDLSNKPTIAGQVNSDWNAVSGSAQILDKPTIPSTTTQIAEGANLYFTNLRAQAALAGLYQVPLGFTPENFANKGAANGYAALDGSLNVLGAGFIGSGSGAGAFEMTQGSAQTPPANSVGLQAPASVPTGFNITLWGVPAVGVLHANSLNVLAPSLILTSDLDPSMPAVDTSGSYTDLLNQPTIPAAITGANPTVTAGVGGVTANYLVARSGTNPVTYVATGPGGCGSGVAASTAAASATFQLYSVAGTMLSMVADNTVTAGDVVIGGSVIPGRVADSGFSARGSVASTVCTVGIAQGSAVAGGAVLVLFDGTGTYGTAVAYASVSGTPAIPGPATATPVLDGTGAVGVSALYARQDHVHPTDTSRAPLVSPAFTGTPTAPTQTAGDASADIATDAFVGAAASFAQGVNNTANNFFTAGGVASKTIVYAGNSTVWQDYTWFDMMCKQTVANGIFAGMACYSANSLSTDNLNNVTVTLCGGTTACTNLINYGSTPSALTVGKFVSFESADSTLGSCIASFPVTSSTATTVVFNNAACAASVYAAAGNAYNTAYSETNTTTVSEQILNFGINGGTLSSALALTSSTGMGIGGILAINPDMVITRGYLINDVRTGTCNLACAEAEQKSWIDQIRFNNPKVVNILIAENSLSNNATCSAYITPTTSAQAYSQILEQSSMSFTGYPTVITLDTQKTIYGTVSPTWTGVATLALNATGSSYAINDIVTLATSGATLKVLTVSSGAIATYQLLTQGSLAAIGTGVVSTDSGSGSGATFNILTVTSDPFMSALTVGCLHPSALGHQTEDLQDVQFLANLAYNAGQQPVPYTPFYANWNAASSYLAAYCRATNYTAPWSVPGCANGWADPLYYKLIASGVGIAQAAGSTFLQVNWPSPSGAPNVAQPYDVVQLQDGNSFQLPNGTATGYSGSFSAGVARMTLGGSGTLTYAIQAGEKVNILRPVFPAQVCEAYANNANTYTYRRAFYINGAGTNFWRISFLPSEGLNAGYSNVVALGSADVACLSGGTTVSLSGISVTLQSAGNLQVNQTGSWAGLQGQWGVLYGTQPMEGQPDANGTVNATGVVGTLTGTATGGTVNCVESVTGTLKIKSCWLNSYSETGTAQTWTFPKPFSTTPVLQAAGAAQCVTTYPASATATVLTLPANASMTASSCNLVLIGQ